MTNLLPFTINFRKSHRQTQCTLQNVCEDGVLRVLHFSNAIQQSTVKGHKECVGKVHPITGHESPELE